MKKRIKPLNHLSSIHASILAHLSKLLHSPGLIAAHRTHDKAFTRQRVLTFPVLASFLLCAVSARRLGRGTNPNKTTRYKYWGSQAHPQHTNSMTLIRKS